MNSRAEEWRPIPGYEGMYEVSNYGKVYSLPKYHHAGRMLKGTKNSRDGRISVMLTDRFKKHRRITIHRLVALAFIPNDDPVRKTEINHKDEDPGNNMADNLEWCDRWYNMHYKNLPNRITREKKAVTGTDSDGKKITFVSLHEAKRNGFDPSGIYASIHKPKKDGSQRAYKGYFWKEGLV